MPSTNSKVWTEAQVGMFPKISKQGSNRNIKEILEDIKSGKWAGQIEALRSLGPDPAAYSKAKKGLPAFMVSASTTGGHKASDIMERSGLMQIDIDHAGAGAVALRDRIGEDPFICAAWLSPGGEGVKGIMRIPTDVEHKDA